MSEIAVNNDDYIRLDEESRKFAVDARGCNVLLAAAAGSGKTTTLVERIVQRIVSGESEAHIDSYLVVTFTNAAAAELRERINGRLSEIFNDAVENGDEELAKRAYRERLLLPKAMIGTIDSFCLDVVKKNFMSAGIDPVFRIDDVEAEIIISEAADEILEKYYADKDSDDYKVLIELVDVFCTIYGDDGLKENLILPVYRYSEDFPNPEEWLAMTEKNYTVDGDIQENVWYKYIKDEMRIVCADILKHIRFILDDLNSGCGRYAALTAPEKYIRIFTQDIEFFKGLAEKIDEAPDRGVLFEDIFKYKDKPPFCRTGSKAEFKTKAAHCIIKSERDKYIRYYEKISESLIDRRKDYETDESVKLQL